MFKIITIHTKLINSFWKHFTIIEDVECNALFLIWIYSPKLKVENPLLLPPRLYQNLVLQKFSNFCNTKKNPTIVWLLIATGKCRGLGKDHTQSWNLCNWRPCFIVLWSLYYKSVLSIKNNPLERRRLWSLTQHI